METGDGGVPPSSSGPVDDAAELAAIDADIARLVSRRNELRARVAAQGPATAKSNAASATNASPNADWYPDPSGRFSWRYWNGSEWTDAVARNGVTYSDPPVSTTPTAPSTSGTSTQPTRTVPGSPPSSSLPTRSATQPMFPKSEVDVGKLILIVGAALLIGGVAGLTVWLWSRLPAVGRLSLLGLAFILQTAIAMRIRERLQTAAEAFAATGAATLLFAVGSVSATATWNGTIGVAVGAVGIALLLLARFRAWVIAGHVAIVVGAVAVLVVEPWSQTVFTIAVILGVVRWIGVRASASLRPQDFNIFPEWLTASGLAALLATPALMLSRFGDNAIALVFVLVAVVVSEIAVRSRSAQRDHEFTLIAGAAVAVAGVGWSAYLWLNNGETGSVLAMVVTGVVALLLWRAGRTEVEFRTALMAVAVGLVPVAARFVCDPASRSELILFCAGAAVAGLAANRIARPVTGQPVAQSLALWFWVGAVIASFSAAEQLVAWPRLALVTVALVSFVPIMKFDELRYAAAATATLAIADLLYNEPFAASWWYRPDLVGVAAAACLYLVNRTQATPRSDRIGTWTVPPYWESTIALLVVPVVNLVTRPTFNDLPNESKWRLGFIAGLSVGSWAYGAVRRARPNALQLTTLVAVAAVIVSRVADESTRIQTGAWTIIGILATIALTLFASIKKIDELRYAAAATATATVAVVLYGELFELSWWFRPDLVGVAAAVSLVVANHAQATPWSVNIGTWTVPRYWESVAALVLVPVAGVATRPAFADLSSDSQWRLGFVATLLVASWAYGAVQGTRPNAAQVVTLVAATVVIVSRVGDESFATRTAAWIFIGFAFIVAALRFRRVELLVPAAASWMLVVFMYSPPGPLEVLTCSLAAIAAVVAVIARRFGRKGTIDFIPATALAIVPSAFAAARAVLDGTVDSEQVARIAVVLVVGAIALAVGTYKRLAALVGPAVIALVVLAVAQLIVVQRNTSGWVSALIAGVVLLVVGTRLEYLRTVSRRASDLVKSLK